MEMRRADILAYSLRSGDATSNHIFALARRLRRHAQEVAIWVNYPPGPLPAEIGPLVRQAHYADYPGGADLTLLQYPLWFPLAERFRQATGARIFWYHGVTPPKLWPAAERDFMRNGEVRTELAWSAHCVVATSPFTADELAGHAHYPRPQIRVVPLGVDARAFARVPAPGELDALRRRWHVEGKRVLLYVGRVAANKRIDLALEALTRLLPKHRDLHLLVVGDTQDGTVTRTLAASLQAQARDLGVAQAVTLTGRVPQIEPYFHLAEVYLQPSEHEGFGVPLIEAMAAGVPVVAGASGAMPWLLDTLALDGTGLDAANGGAHAAPAGLLFTSGSSADLARQVGRLLADPALHRDLVERGRARAEDFSMARFETAVDGVVAVALGAHKNAGADLSVPPVPPLLRAADVALRDYRVRSRLPGLGRAIEWLRVHSTTHFKEAYLDRIVEQQVNFNRLAARHLLELRAEIEQMQRDLTQATAHTRDGTTTAHSAGVGEQPPTGGPCV